MPINWHKIESHGGPEAKLDLLLSVLRVGLVAPGLKSASRAAFLTDSEALIEHVEKCYQAVLSDAADAGRSVGREIFDEAMYAVVAPEVAPQLQTFDRIRDRLSLPQQRQLYKFLTEHGARLPDDETSTGVSSLVSFGSIVISITLMVFAARYIDQRFPVDQPPPAFLVVGKLLGWVVLLALAVPMMFVLGYFFRPIMYRFPKSLPTLGTLRSHLEKHFESRAQQRLAGPDVNFRDVVESLLIDSGLSTRR